VFDYIMHLASDEVFCGCDNGYGGLGSCCVCSSLHGVVQRMHAIAGHLLCSRFPFRQQKCWQHVSLKARGCPEGSYCIEVAEKSLEFYITLPACVLGVQPEWMGCAGTAASSKP
jgi:hypothetical protein